MKYFIGWDIGWESIIINYTFLCYFYDCFFTFLLVHPTAFSSVVFCVYSCLFEEAMFQTSEAKNYIFLCFSMKNEKINKSIWQPNKSTNCLHLHLLYIFLIANEIRISYDPVVKETTYFLQCFNVDIIFWVMYLLIIHNVKVVKQYLTKKNLS